MSYQVMSKGVVLTVPNARERQQNYLDTLDKKHKFKCPSCGGQTTKWESQEKCKHCSVGLVHHLEVFGFASDFRTEFAERETN